MPPILQRQIIGELAKPLVSCLFRLSFADAYDLWYLDQQGGWEGVVGWVVDYELYVTRKPLMIIIPFSFLVTESEAMLAPGSASMAWFLF